MKKIFFRVLGYAVCALLMILCVLLVIASALFGAKKTVDVFGTNIYVTENDDMPSAPKGSAVLVKKSTAADLEEGKAVLYLKADENDNPTLGYVNGLSARDGVYYISVSYRGQPYEFPESKMIGRADYSSRFWGGLIEFIRTPLGVLVMAVLPCAALILFDIIRAVIAKRPEPEVVPKVKNVDEETHTDIKLSVDTEGKALYSKDRSLKPLSKDSKVLFNYSGKQKDVKKELSKNDRPIIPLTDKKTAAAAPKTAPHEKTSKVFDVKIPVDESETSKGEEFRIDFKKPNPAVIKSDLKSSPSASEGVRTHRSEKLLERVPEKTAELPVISKKPNSDAFFAQPSAGRQIAPQIGRSRPPRTAAEGDSEPVSRAVHSKQEKTAGKRSTQILASKSLDDIFSDDDDLSYSRGINDKTVDNILAGIDRHK